MEGGERGRDSVGRKGGLSLVHAVSPGGQWKEEADKVRALQYNIVWVFLLIMIKATTLESGTYIHAPQGRKFYRNNTLKEGSLYR